ncbi:MAG: hypothetical protein V5A79_04665 [Candidatus Bipolaricaulota bacterium]|nr:hypothetical protein [Candidatus Bipolaricaulota bacterium]
MFNKKLLITIGLVIGLVSSVIVVGQASYDDDVSNLFTKAARVMEQMDDDIWTPLEQGTISWSIAGRNAKKYEQQAFSHLEEIVQLTTEAPNMDSHVRLVEVFTGWHIVTSLVEKGLSEGETEPLKAAIHVMNYVKTLRSEILKY